MKRVGVEGLLIECPVRLINDAGDIITICSEGGSVVFRNETGSIVPVDNGVAPTNCEPLTATVGGVPDIVYAGGEIVMVCL